MTDVFLLVKSFLRQMGIECWAAERNCVPCIFNCLAYVSEKRMLLHRLKLSHKRSNTAWTKLILCVVSLLAVNKMWSKTRRSKSPVFLQLIDSEHCLTFLKLGPLPNPLKCKCGPENKKAVDRLGPFENLVHQKSDFSLLPFSFSYPHCDPE